MTEHPRQLKPGEAVLEARGLSFTYRRRRRRRGGRATASREVLSSFDLVLGAGEARALLGPNGSGKSTFLRLVAGLLPLTGAGELRYLGERLERGGTRALLAQLGMVFQEPSLDRGLTVRQNLSLAGRMYGMGKAEREERAESLLETLGMLERADESVGTLSGGLRRRVDLARALLHRPTLLLMDEPTTGLDEASFRGLWDHLSELRRRETLAILVATHRPEEAERCDAVSILESGRVVAEGSPERLRASLSEDVVELVVESPEEAQALAAEVSEAFDVSCLTEGAAVLVTCARGHALIPQLVEAHSGERLRSVSLRRPGLADVFLNVTGQALLEEAA